MARLEIANRGIRQFIPNILGRRTDRAVTDQEWAVVRLLNSQSATPPNPIQQALVRALNEAGDLSLAVLVKRVAGQLYRDELRKGAATLDIGLFGDRLFSRDVVHELDAGNGIFWEIRPQREARS